MPLKWDVDRGQLDPTFANDVAALFAADAAEWVITQGYRSLADQTATYKRLGGHGAAVPGHSAHEYRLAVDFCEVVDGKRQWQQTSDGWARIMAAVDQHPRLHGGWKFPPVAPPDWDHIQSTRWYTVRDELKAQGVW